MAIEKYQPKGATLFSSPITRTALGFATHGVGGAALGLLSAKNPAAGNAIALGEAASHALGGSDNGDSPNTDANYKMPTLGSSEYDPMSNRMSILEQDPAAAVDHGISLLDHPDVPPDIKHMAAHYLIGAKIYGGPHPNIDYNLRQNGHLMDEGES